MRKQTTRNLFDELRKWFLKIQKLNLIQIILFLTSLLFLFPLSIDGQFKIEISHYSIRLNYLAVIISTLLLLYQFKVDTRLKNFYIQFFKYHYKLIYSLALFFLIGLIGISNSYVPFRSVLFLIWSLGTITSLIIILTGYRYYFRQYFEMSFIVYALILSSIIIIDSFICSFPGAPSIGRIIIDPDLKGCRPFAFYQEPNYFAAFGLICLIFIRNKIENRFKQSLNLKYSTLIRNFYIFSYFLLASAILLSTSKTGWFGVGFIFVCEVFYWIFSRPKNYFNFKKLLISSCMFLFLLFFLAGIFKIVEKRNPFLSYVYYSVKNILYVGNAGGRGQNAIVAIDIFKQSPFLGVGPGGAGAYISTHYKKMPNAKAYIELLGEKRFHPEDMKNDPFFFNIFSELLTEWGLLGLICFSFILFYFLRGNHLFLNTLTFGVMIIVGCTWQTLARMDFWTGIILIWLSNQKTKEL